MAKKLSKKMDAEERKEFKGGKYMGGPAEEAAEKKKGKKSFGKKMADGGTARYGKNMGRPDERGSMPGVRMGQIMRPVKRPGTPTNYPGIERPGRGNEGMGNNVVIGRPAPIPRPGLPKPGTPIMNDPGFSSDIPPGLGGRTPMPRPVPGIPGATYRGMRGGGLARKGVGQALAKGGLAKGAGCAQRGVHKPRMK